MEGEKIEHESMSAGSFPRTVYFKYLLLMNDRSQCGLEGGQEGCTTTIPPMAISGKIGWENTAFMSIAKSFDPPSWYASMKFW